MISKADGPPVIRRGYSSVYYLKECANNSEASGILPIWLARTFHTPPRGDGSIRRRETAETPFIDTIVIRLVFIQLWLTVLHIYSGTPVIPGSDSPLDSHQVLPRQCLTMI